MDSSEQPVVAAYTDHQLDKYSLFEKTINAAGFFETLEARQIASGKGKDDFFVVIKPNIAMMLRRDDIGTYTDTFLVIHLLRLLVRKGYENLAVVESQNLYGNWFHNRSVVQTAARAGYFDEAVIQSFQGETSYDIEVSGDCRTVKVPLIDLTHEKTAHRFGEQRIDIGKAWAEADFRVTVSGIKSHFYSYYTMAIKNIYGCLPEQDKVRGYHCKRKVGPWTAELIRDFPVDFSVIAGYSGADGWMGVKMKAIFVKPHTIIASKNIMAVDHFGANLIGHNPDVSVMFKSLKTYMEVPDYRVKGNASLDIRWRKIPWFLPFVSRVLESNANIMDFGGSIATGGNDPCFPPKAVTRHWYKKILFVLSVPAELFCDIDMLRLKLRKRIFKYHLFRIRKKIPTIYNIPYIKERLYYFSGSDLESLISALEQFNGSRLRFSGHYVRNGREGFFLPSRFNPAVISTVEIVNHMNECKSDNGLVRDELKHLGASLPTLFNRTEPYPWCFR